MHILSIINIHCDFGPSELCFVRHWGKQTLKTFLQKNASNNNCKNYTNPKLKSILIRFLIKKKQKKQSQTETVDFLTNVNLHLKNFLLNFFCL